MNGGWPIGPVLILLLATLQTACGLSERPGLEGTAVPRVIQDQQTESRPVLHRGKRLLAIDLTMPEAQDYDASVALAQSAGAKVTSLSVYWDDIEVGPGIFRPDPNRLAIANQYYPAHKMQLSLMARATDSNRLRLSQDSADSHLNDPRVIERSLGLLD